MAVSLVLLLVAVPVVLAAQPQRRGQPAAQPSVWELTPPQQQQNEFVPIKDLPRPQEQLPAAPLVMGAYAFVWVALLVYVWSVWRRVGAVQRELADLRKRMERKA